jgi:hypothetical protein
MVVTNETQWWASTKGDLSGFFIAQAPPLDTSRTLSFAKLLRSLGLNY